jgi:UDP-N-acetyl-D-mannosaminuronic acid dehydrogenase
VKFNKICVLGLGYIGLPTASTFAAHGIHVVGVDINAQIVHNLQNGDLHINEPGLCNLVQGAIRSGNLIFRREPEEADAFIVAVPTPFLMDKRADMSFVISAIESILPVLRTGNLVVLESTSPPRTTISLVAPILERSNLKVGEDFYLAYSPERVLPGQILRELIENARVIGGVNSESAEVGKQLYSTFVQGEIITTDATTAEMVKLMENTYRDVNIAIANEFSRLTDRFGVDVWEAIEIANRHPRVKILNPGPGVGGHCISVDPWFLVEAAPDLAQLIHSARQVNDSQPQFVVDLVRCALGELEGKNIVALGLSYKPDVDDLRESPAIEVCRILHKAGAHVQAFEPNKPDAIVPGVDLVPDFITAIADADVLLLLVGHSPIRSINPSEIARFTKAKVVVDTVNVWSPREWNSQGFHYFRLGGLSK